MRTINALRAGDLARGLAGVQKDINKLNADLTGANSEPVRKSAGALLKNWRKLLDVPGHGAPAAPGQAPHRQTRKLRRSLGTAVVDGIRRVGSGWFVSRLQEFGFTAQDGTQVAPRPHGRVAFAQSEKEMVDVQVSEMQKRIAKGA
jgi:hypothetical protein